MSRTIKSLGGWTTVTHEILYSRRFLQLQNIGGCYKYHQEGNAFTHSMLVYYNMCQLRPDDKRLQCVALLHDIGKLETGWVNEDGDWAYPNHSNVGAEMLSQFIDPEYIYFEDMKWLIRNHIKPLFWRDKGLTKEQALTTLSLYKGHFSMEEIFNDLRFLVICDLKGSIPADYADSVETINYLWSL